LNLDSLRCFRDRDSSVRCDTPVSHGHRPTAGLIQNYAGVSAHKGFIATAAIENAPSAVARMSQSTRGPLMLARDASNDR
jgi:hypothetical protein